jgi:hypothetical protein
MFYFHVPSKSFTFLAQFLVRVCRSRICVTQCSGHDARFVFHFASPFTSAICIRSRRQMHIARDTAICRDPPVHSCTRDSKNVTGPSSVHQQLKAKKKKFFLSNVNQQNALLKLML